MAALITKGEGWEDTDAVLMKQVMTNDGTYLQQADLSSITYSVFDKADTSTATAEGTLTIDDVVFDTLQTDSRWGVDSLGYNFAWEAPGTLFPAGGKTYRVECWCTTISGSVFPLVFEHTTGDLYRS